MTEGRRFTGIHGLALFEEIERLLEANGLSVLYSDDMERFCAVMDGWKAFVHPRFRACHNDQAASRFLAVRRGDAILGLIAFTAIETHDYARMIRDGSAFVRDPWAHGWAPMRAGRPETPLAGRLHFRGGLRVVENGLSLSWYLTGLHEALFFEDRADFIVAHATPQIVEAGLPPWLYGYHHRMPLPEHRIPWEGRWNALSLLWSTEDEIAHVVEQKTRLLRARQDDELRRPVQLWKALNKPEE